MSLICNSIPKSGTFFLSSLASVCGFTDSKVRFLDRATNLVDDENRLVESHKDAGMERFIKMGENTHTPSHL